MIVTAGQLISLCLDTIGAVNIDETPTPGELSSGLMRLNMMIDAWSVDNLMLLGAIMEQFPLTAGTANYTIGPTGTFATSRPSAITTAFIRDGNNLDTGLDVVSLDEWNSYEDKDFSSARPTALYYDPGVTQQATFLGVLWLYPIPDASTPYTLFIGEEKPLTEFSNLDDIVTFQPAYYEALLYNLAVRIYRSFFKHSKPIPPDVVDLAREAKRVIERMNDNRVHMQSDFPAKKGTYNIYTDGWN